MPNRHHRRPLHQTDIVIIGAGIAGALPPLAVCLGFCNGNRTEFAGAERHATPTGKMRTFHRRQGQCAQADRPDYAARLSMEPLLPRRRATGGSMFTLIPTWESLGPFPTGVAGCSILDSDKRRSLTPAPQQSAAFAGPRAVRRVPGFSNAPPQL